MYRTHYNTLGNTYASTCAYTQAEMVLCRETDMLKDQQPNIISSWLAEGIPTERSLD